MRIAVTGASGVIGRGVVLRLLSAGHDIVGVARRRPESWPSQATFVQGDIRDAAAVQRVVEGAEVVVHCAWAVNPTADEYEVNVGGTRNVLDAMACSGTRRIVFASSAHVYGSGTSAVSEADPLQPVSTFGRDKVSAEEMVAACGAEWVTIRASAILGRGVDNWVQRVLASAFFPEVDEGRTLQVVHSDDAQRVFVRAAVDPGIGNGPVNLAATGELTLREIAETLGRPFIRLPRILRKLSQAAELDLLLSAPSLDTALLHNKWNYTPAWTGQDCLHDVALAVRGRVSIGLWSTSLPWRLTHVQDIPAVDIPAADGMATVKAGPEGGNGEFDTPIDPRFPTYLATNLSEALPGPFSPSSASVTVKGLRASGAVIARRLRPGGLIQREMATRTVGVFANRLYGAITTAHYMAEVVPFVKPETVVRQSQFFGPSVAATPIHGEQQLPHESNSTAGPLRTIRNLGVFGVNLAGLIVGAPRDTADFVNDIEWLEEVAVKDLSQLTEPRLQSLILLARDHVIDGWVLASGSFMAFAALSVILRGLNGRDIVLPVGQELASAGPLSAVYRLADAAQRDPNVARVLAGAGDHLDELSTEAPEFHQTVLAELRSFGHRGPAELEMRSSSYSDDPELLLRMVSKSLDTQVRSETSRPVIPLRARPVALLAAHQVRDREVRRDRVVRANWVLRNLLRELGRRLVKAGALDTVDDVFYFLVDELDALPADTAALVARRRAEQRRLAGVVPPAVFSGDWRPTTAEATVLSAGETLVGAGVSGGRVRGRVRIIRPETIDDLEAGEILVAEVTDVGYTAAFSYAGAVVTELGGPMSHAAVVAREFGIPCVVDVHDATRRLPPGALIEVDGTSGTIQVLEPDLPSATTYVRYRRVMHEHTVRVTTAAGTVEGFTRDGVHRWRSIPYARPPVSALRFRAPEPAQPWRGVRYCHGFTKCAPQEHRYAVLGVGKYQPMGEDCLTLNVVAPEAPQTEPLPVMVFVHGGGYIMGSSATPIYDGVALAKRGCIYVSVNYRLGALGCLDLSSLSTSDATIDSNLFLRDLLLALRWVHDNIAVFGGDRANVTVFGESAGAHAVAALLAAPEAEGLFAQAISESPASGMTRSTDVAAEFAARFATLLGADKQDAVHALMKASPAELVAAQNRLINDGVRDMLGAFPIGPVFGDDVLPLDPIDAMRQGKAHRVPLIVGTNADEGRLFTRFLQLLPTNEPMIEALLAEVEPAARERITDAYPDYPERSACIRLGGDFAFGSAAWAMAEAHGRYAPTYLYRYDYAPRVLRWSGLGATHATELLAVFGVYRTKLGAVLTAPADRRSAMRVTREVQRAWRSFSRTGSPGDSWPVYTDTDRPVMVFDRKSHLEFDPHPERRMAWEGFSLAR